MPSKLSQASRNKDDALREKARADWCAALQMAMSMDGYPGTRPQTPEGLSDGFKSVQTLGNWISGARLPQSEQDVLELLDRLTNLVPREGDSKIAANAKAALRGRLHESWKTFDELRKKGRRTGAATTAGARSTRSEAPGVAPPSHVEALAVAAAGARQPRPKLDPYIRADMAGSYFRALGKLITRIDLAQVGGRARLRTLPLTELYVGLIADPTSLDERHEARNLDAAGRDAASRKPRDWRAEILHRPSETGLVRRMLNDQLPGEVTSFAPPVSGSLPPPTASAGESLHEVVARERRCVILGDPGSGKSVLCRWLTSELSHWWEAGRPSPTLGFVRMPFLIVLRDLAQCMSERKATSLRDYLIRCACPPHCADDADAWKLFVEEVLDEGAAFLILDGLDEVSGDARRRIRQMIDVAAREEVDPAAARGAGPARAANQMIVTSRRTGYYQSPLAPARFSHFLIRPMTDGQISEFCRHWCEAAKCIPLTDPLLVEIFDPVRPSIHALARNPLLLSILCQLGTADRGSVVHLPQIRSELYEKVVFETASSWRANARQGLALTRADAYFEDLLAGEDNVLALFAPVAGHMHRALASPDIDRGTLQKLLVAALAWFEGKSEHELDPVEWDARQEMLMDALERVVGVMSERMPQRYQFLHLTFQEYLAGISLLIGDPHEHVPGGPNFDGTAQFLVDRILREEMLPDPRWRQPLLLLFGQLAWMELCRRNGSARPAPALADVVQLLDEQHEAGRSGLLGEQWAGFLAEVMAEVPDDLLIHSQSVNVLLIRTVTQMLDAYARLGARRGWRRAHALASERLAVIRRRVGAEAFESVLFGICSSPRSSSWVLAAAELLLDRAWVSQAAIDFFACHRRHDSATWHWPIHRFLGQAASAEGFAMVLAPMPRLEMPPLANVDECRRHREAFPEWQRLSLEHAERWGAARGMTPSPVRASGPLRAEAMTHWPKLGLAQRMAFAAILGGFGDMRSRERMDLYNDLAAWLSLDDARRAMMLDAWALRLVPLGGSENTPLGIAKHLDDGPEIFFCKTPVAFDADAVHRGDALALAGLRAIRSGDLEEIVAAGRSGDAVDASEVRAVCRLVGRDDLALTVPGEESDESWHWGRIGAELSDACFRGAPAITRWLTNAVASSWGVTTGDFVLVSNDLEDARRWWMHRVFARAWAACGRFGTKADPARQEEPLKVNLRKEVPLKTRLRHVAEDWLSVVVSDAAEGRDRFNDCVVSVSPLDARGHQALVRHVAESAGAAVLRLQLPDLIDLGLGLSSMPPLAFYEAVQELCTLIIERRKTDTAQFWVAAILDATSNLDPLSNAYLLRFYEVNGTVDDSEPKPPTDPEAAALRGWRLSLLPHIVAPVEMSAGETGGRPSLDVAWRAAWDGCSTAVARLVLSRDALLFENVSSTIVEGIVRPFLVAVEGEAAGEAALVLGAAARIANPRDRRNLLRQAFDRAEQVDDVLVRAEIIRALSSLADDTLCDLLSSSLSRLPPDVRAIAAGQPSRYVRAALEAEGMPDHGDIADALAATLAVASALELQEIGRRSGAPKPPLLLPWIALAEALEARRPETELRECVDDLVDQVGIGSAPLTDAAIAALQAAVARPVLAEAAGFSRLLVLLERAPAPLVPRLRELRTQISQILQRAGDAFSRNLQSYLTLWICESERRIGVDDLHALYALRRIGDDRCLARLDGLVHATEWWLGDRRVLYSLHALRLHGSRETMERLGELAVGELDVSLAERLAAGALYEWFVDDPDVVGQWLARLDANPADDALRASLFKPWRWSPSCLAAWRRWIAQVQDPEILRECTVWLAAMHVAASDSPRELPREFVPELPDGLVERLPDVSWLPGKNADLLVLDALFGALSEARDPAEVASRAAELLADDELHFAETLVADPSVEARLLSLGSAVTQRIGEVPELALDLVQSREWEGNIISSLMVWTRRCLTDWVKSHDDDARLALKMTVVSQLSVLACLVDLSPNAVRRAAEHAAGAPATGTSSWTDLLCSVLRHSSNNRLTQAAWTVLPFVCSGGVNSESVWTALRLSVRSTPIVRFRAIAALASEDGRRLFASLSDDSIRLELGRLRSETSGQTLLAMARVFCVLACEPGLDAALRQEILLGLRMLSTGPAVHRRLFQTVGDGSIDSPFRIVAGAMLDEELRTLEAELYSRISVAGT
jgi:hypothetical protein